jgi:hypothetical protein
MQTRLRSRHLPPAVRADAPPPTPATRPLQLEPKAVRSRNRNGDLRLSAVSAGVPEVKSDAADAAADVKSEAAVFGASVHVSAKNSGTHKQNNWWNQQLARRYGRDEARIMVSGRLR